MEKARYDVFLSHATPDKPAVEELARLLKKRGFEPWLDKWNLVPGEPWQEAIEKALEDCTACAVCLGPSGTGPWQNEEMRAAIDRRVSEERGRIRVIPVLLPGAERGEPSRLPAFLRATTWVEFRETLDDEKALHRLDCGIRGIPPGSDPGEAVAEGACPYRGLQVFDVGDALFFFGREALTGWLLDKLRTDRTGNRFLAIVGPSGSGKSSLARAGLVANLKRGEIPGSDAWPVAICKPGAQPLESLAVALAVALAGAARLGDSPSAVRELIRDLGTDPRMLHLTTRVSLREAPADRRLVVLVDQFEEVFTLCPDEAQRKSIIANLLHAATAADGQTVIVVTLRADFYGRCAAYPDLAAAVSDRQSLVGPMTRDELRSAVERPAYLTGCELEGGLADLLLNEVAAQPGSLPLLEHALLQIWQRREGGRRLTVAAYHEIGGVAGALEKHAEEVYASFSEDEKETCRHVFLRLVQVDEQGRATKRRLGLDDLAPASEVGSRATETVISRLTNARLLTTDQEKRSTVELAHEALLANWDRLKQWIEQDREALRTRRRLDEAVAEWLGKNRDSSFLLEGGRLAQAEEWANRHPGEMGPDTDARKFLKASIAQRDEERNRLKRWTIAAGLIAAIAIVAFITALYSRYVADQQWRIARAGELGERSRTTFGSNPQLGLLLAVQATKMASDAGKPYLPAAQSALRWTLSRSGGIPLPSGPVESVMVTRDRRLLATMGKDSHLRLWDLQADSPSLSNRDLGEVPKDTLPKIAAPSALKWILIAGVKGSWLLDMRDSDASLSSAVFLKGEDWLFKSEPFSPDGRWLTTRKAGDMLLRDLSKPQAVPIILSQMENIEAFSFGPNGLILAAASSSGLVKLWDLSTPIPTANIVKLPGDEKTVSLAFLNDQVLLATTWLTKSNEFAAWSIRSNGTLERSEPWSCSDGKELFAQAGLFVCSDDLMRSPDNPSPDGNLYFDDASPDRRWRALRTIKGTIYLQGIPAQNDSSPLPLIRVTSAQLAVFSATSRWLVTQVTDESPRLWDLRKGLGITDSEPLIFRDSTIPLLTTTGEGLRWDLDSNKLRLWKLSGEPSPQGFPGSEGLVPPYAISADGQRFAAVTQKESLLLWKIGLDGRVTLPIPLPGRVTLRSLEFSPSGHWLAALDVEGHILLWNLRTPKASPFQLTNASPRSPLAFSPSDNLLATVGSRGAIHLRALDKRGPKVADSPHTPATFSNPRALAFSPDGKWLAIGGRSDRIQLWNVKGHNVFLESRSEEIDSLAFSPDGQWLASGGYDGVVQLWKWGEEKTDPTPILLEAHEGSVLSVAFTPQGLASAALDNTIRLWQIRTDKLIKLACQSAGRTLSKREWSTYIPSEDYRANEPCPGLPKAPD